ncbi:putative FAD-binding PCMH-type domain-containing protein [Candidatus Hydrogenisulfobacillus filiaventi]|uniref:Putative FAD-binding PCMH-type domain-containing protein n=1 Tax=Candidatus Hydrogenisulfobacillus filiaventi TaxID=2707344 RepID=A0A6F8ZDE5_9FIRM|nr:putative FAD-binding PCMH-type domain-containing protein [Candidatus Hydrogenisulfobacillus filiaventi]
MTRPASLPPLAGALPRPEAAARPDPVRRRRLAEALQRALGPGRVHTDPAAMLPYSYDATGERWWPDAVVLPQSAGEAATAVRIAGEVGVPVVARGRAATSRGAPCLSQGGWSSAWPASTASAALTPSAGWPRWKRGWSTPTCRRRSPATACSTRPTPPATASPPWAATWPKTRAGRTACATASPPTTWWS